MKLLIIMGNSSVGKMTVGQEVCKITDFRLFHNHMSIEPVLEIFGKMNKQVVQDFRESVFKNFAKSDNYGLIFTCMMDFDSKEDWAYLNRIRKIFKKAEQYFVELVAPQEIRLARNVTENRLKNKASKRNVEVSNQRLINDDKKYRLESRDGELDFENYIKIDNSNLSPEQTAQMIKEKFGFVKTEHTGNEKLTLLQQQEIAANTLKQPLQTIKECGFVDNNTNIFCVVAATDKDGNLLTGEKLKGYKGGFTLLVGPDGGILQGGSAFSVQQLIQKYQQGNRSK